MPRTVAIPDLFAALMPYGNTSLYGEVMSSEGVLRDINRRQNTTQLLVGEGEFNLQVELPCPLSTPLPNWMVPGATVKVTGTDIDLPAVTLACPSRWRARSRTRP